MKKAIAFIGLVILFQSALKCQEINVEILKADSLKKGIYLTFEEFQQNNPSLRANFGIMEHDQIVNKVYNNMSIFKLYIQDTTNTYSKLRKIHWGVCDGKNAFISFNGKYLKLSLDGKYCSFADEQYIADSYYVNSLGQSGPNLTLSSVYHFLNMTNNNIKTGNPDRVKEILKQENQNLYLEFKNEKDKRLMMFEYINRLNRTFIYK